MQLYNHPLFNDSSLKAYYRFEDNVNDSKGSYNLTTSGSYVTGKYGKALNGYSMGAEVSSDCGVVGLSAWTMSGWFKVVDYPNDSSRHCWYLSSSSVKVSAGVRYIKDSGVYKLDFWRDRTGPGTVRAYYAVDLKDGKWHHLAMTYDGTNLIGYLDGKQVASTTQSGSGTNSTTNWIRIAYTGSYGYIDDVGFFGGKTLTAAEIMSLFQDGMGGILAGLL